MTCVWTHTQEDAGKGTSGSGKYVPVESKVAAIFKVRD